MLKSAAQIEKMAVAGRLVADVLDRVGRAVEPGVTTLELDALAEQLIRERGGIPSFIGVPGHLSPYKHSLCISLDDEVVHGIPASGASARVRSSRWTPAQSSMAGTAMGPAPSPSASTRRGLGAGLGNATRDVRRHRRGRARQFPLRHLCGNRGRRAAARIRRGRSFVGHGIGTEMHEEPQVTNFRTGNRGRRIEPGLCLAIEPMFTLGGHDVHVRDDGWTVETRDGSLAAHWEHSIAITENGPRILTINDGAADDEVNVGRAQATAGAPR